MSDDILDPVAPYLSSREHLLDEIAILRARTAALIGGPQASPEDTFAAPDPVTVERRVMLSVAAGIDLRLPRLEYTFALSAVERGVLLCTLASEVDPLFRSVCRGLQGELAGPTLQVGTIIELITRQLEQAVDAALLFLPDGKLRASALVTVEDPLSPRDVPLQALRVKIDRNVGLYLLGARDSSAPEWLKLVRPQPVLGKARLPAERKADLTAYMHTAMERRAQLTLELSGPPGVGRKFLAEGLCHELGRPMLVANCQAVSGPLERDNLGARLAEVRRETALSGALPYLDNYDQLLTRQDPLRARDDEQSQQVAPTPMLIFTPELKRFLETAGVAFVGAIERYEPLEQAGEVVRIALTFPSPRQRAAIWEQVYEDLSAKLGEDVDLVEIGRKLALDAQRIQAAARASVSAAALRTRMEGPLVVTRADVMEASKNQLQHDLKSLAVRVDKAYRWEDLVISVDGYHSLLEMISYAANAEQVYDKWGFGNKHTVAQGISALFSGPPGTGKTMCASVIARELDMELFRVDLSRVVSKWIGETEKNLARVFDEAQRSNAVVLFDEADSLFAKRTEVKSSVDRYANLEVNFLLQRMETFNGITILTTNFEDTIDTAFKRRLTFRIRFEKPDADARAALWAKMFPEGAELAADVSFEELGRRYEVSGGNIRNAAIRSAFLAASEGHAIDMNTLVRATLREAREMGVLIAEERGGAPVEPVDELKPDAANGDGDGDEAPLPPGGPSSRPPKLVPITHRR
ncbi:MAG TPA: AAA family ATPase [Polyangia bacterium]|nr:AAA family ATPase [Polyangia bacterium]